MAKGSNARGPGLICFAFQLAKGRHVLPPCAAFYHIALQRLWVGFWKCFLSGRHRSQVIFQFLTRKRNEAKTKLYDAQSIFGCKTWIFIEIINLLAFGYWDKDAIWKSSCIHQQKSVQHWMSEWKYEEASHHHHPCHHYHCHHHHHRHHCHCLHHHQHHDSRLQN